MPSPQTKIVHSADGTKIYAEALGDHTRFPLVFIHGGFLSAMSYDAIFEDEDWSQEYYMVRYDKRGHGRSGKPVEAEAWHSERMAEDFSAVVEAFDVKQPIVFAWSVGGTHVVDILSYKPADFISGIVHIAGVPSMGRLSEVITATSGDMLRKMADKSDVQKYQDTSIAFIDAVSSATTLPYAIHQAFLGDVMTQPKAVTDVWLKREQDDTGMMEAGQHGVPMLVIWGTEDKLVVGANVAKLFAESGWQKLHAIGIVGADHIPWVSRRQEFKAVVMEWMKKIVG